MSLVRAQPFLAGVIAALAVAALASSFLSSFNLFLAGQLGVLITITVALSVLMGGVGILALSSSTFMALGGYATLILMQHAGLPLILAIVLACLAGAALGAVIGLVALRISGFHFAILTLAFLQFFLAVIKRGGEFTGGGYGLVVPPLSLPLIGDLTTARIATGAVFLAVLTSCSCAILMKSRVGRAWLALRDNEPAARMQGIDSNRMKVLAFTFTSALICLAGVFHAFLLGVTNPTAYNIDTVVFHLTLVVVGGMTGSIPGAVISPFILYLIPELFHEIAAYRDYLYAAILLLTLILMPNGISVFLTDVWKKLVARRPQ